MHRNPTVVDIVPLDWEGEGDMAGIGSEKRHSMFDILLLEKQSGMPTTPAQRLFYVTWKSHEGANLLELLFVPPC